MNLLKYYKTIVWLVVMSYLLFSPGSALPQTRMIDIPHSDKIIHYLMFLGFAVVWLHDSKNNSKFIIISVLISSICFAALSELVQHYFIIGRFGNIYDFLSDFFGLLSGIILYFAMYKKFIDKKQSQIKNTESF
jgi:VanZ family protein